MSMSRDARTHAGGEQRWVQGARFWIAGWFTFTYQFRRGPPAPITSLDCINLPPQFLLTRALDGAADAARDSSDMLRDHRCWCSLARGLRVRGTGTWERALVQH